MNLEGSGDFEVGRWLNAKVGFGLWDICVFFVFWGNI